MSDRIRHLEDALQVLQSSCSPDPHPLLAPDLLNIKSALTLYGEAQTGAGHNLDFVSPPEEANKSPRTDSKSTSQRSSDEISERNCHIQVNPAHYLISSNLTLHRTWVITNRMTVKSRKKSSV